MMSVIVSDGHPSHALKTFRKRFFEAAQIADGDARIFGVMIESHLKAGRQDLMPGKELVYGLSITDACVGWEDTRKLVEDLARCSSPASPQGGG